MISGDSLKHIVKWYGEQRYEMIHVIELVGCMHKLTFQTLVSLCECALHPAWLQHHAFISCHDIEMTCEGGSSWGLSPWQFLAQKVSPRFVNSHSCRLSKWAVSQVNKLLNPASMAQKRNRAPSWYHLLMYPEKVDRLEREEQAKMKASQVVTGLA